MGLTGVMEPAIAVFALVMGAGIAGLWSADLVRGRVDLSRGAARSRDVDSGSLLLPHWLAEFATAAVLLAGGVGLLLGLGWAVVLTAAGLGACAYTSVNSLGWALARPGRRPYAVPMLVGAVGSLLGVAGLLVS